MHPLTTYMLGAATTTAVQLIASGIAMRKPRPVPNDPRHSRTSKLYIRDMQTGEDQ